MVFGIHVAPTRVLAVQNRRQTVPASGRQRFYDARLSPATKMFRKILRIESLTDSARLCQPTEAQNSPRAAMNFLSSIIRLGSRSDLISPLHPPKPLNAMLHQASHRAAAQSDFSSLALKSSPRPCLVAVLAKLTSKAMVEESSSRSRK